MNIFLNSFLSQTTDPVLLFGLLSFCFILIALPFSLWAVGGDKSSSLSRTLIALSNLFLTSQLVLRWWQAGHFPISNLYESLCFLTWAITLTYLLVERSLNSPLVGAFSIPMSLLTISFASFVLPDELKIASPLVPALRSSWLIMHVSVIMCSYAALIIGSLLSAAVLLTGIGDELQIRSNSIGVGAFKSKYAYHHSQQNITSLTPDSIKISNIENLDSLSYRTITFGFLLLTLGLISGAVWANEAWGSWWSWDPKETWALICWLVYAAYLHVRLVKGWQGKRPALVAVSGLFLIGICYIGVNLLGVGLHSYGWFL